MVTVETTMLLLLALLVQASWCALPPTCDSPVYCHGPLLHTVQMAKIFNDSKTFVDLKIKTSEEQVLQNFNQMLNETNNPTHDEIKQFVNNNFEDGKELENWLPPDFKEKPSFLSQITDEKLKNFGQQIVSLWKILARKMNSDVQQNPSQYSLIYLPNGFIIPGGRFKEIYYWDTYWIIRGLLISEMKDTAKGMIENLMHLVKQLGHVPNGSRVYYKQRSQPPLLTRMVAQYINYTGDYDWLKENIHILDQELEYWIKERMVRVKKRSMVFRMFHYNAPSEGPRPESYREDVMTSQSFNDTQEAFNQLKSGAESGWDFSSRWFFDSEGQNTGNLSNIDTTRVIPVDLNAIIYDAFLTLGNLYDSLKNHTQAIKWKTKARMQEFAITNILWSEKHGIWLDYDLKLSKHRPYFYPSNVMPLMTDCCVVQKSNYSVKKILQFLKDNNIPDYPGGTPTSTIQSGEQWDFPNAWPPLQSILIYSLANTKNEEAQKLAFDLADKWVQANYLGFQDSGEMFEKYDAEQPGKYGGGGEYVVQAGFGWTNGVILELLNTYGQSLKAP